MSLITIKDLVKRYGSYLALDNLSFDINEGEVFGLLGPNGAGKSTTIKILMGLLKYNSGEIYVNGIEVRKDPQETKKLLGLVPQDIAIYEGLSAKENVEFFGSLYGLGRKELKQKTEEALGFVGLKDKAKDKPKSFSGGMKRRLNIACAIVHQPKIIIMDEPTVGIDPQSRNHILESVRELNRRGSTIIYTSHYMEEVDAVCERVGIIDHGKLIAYGDKNQVKKLHKTDEIISIEATDIRYNPIEELKKINGVKSISLKQNTIEISSVNAQAILQDALFVLSKGGIKVRNIGMREPDLESVFLSLTGRSLRD
ncbi:ABC transporter ATP-binding protein [Desnuesiella massiliensis]|uniref:ABC transporter ATP-binding protein n=1 Tax=Desnuesiella massiliensis TaxID=1650662 RepID=UPI0006E24700|nr:ABC transporter ATP-binding protein [Desnuesiella massiliensis]